MDIKVRFEPEQEVWTLYNNKVVSGLVCQITVNVESDFSVFPTLKPTQKTKESYLVQSDAFNPNKENYPTADKRTFNVESLFGSKEQLLESL